MEHTTPESDGGTATITPPPQPAIGAPLLWKMDSTPSAQPSGSERSPQQWLDIFLNDQQDLTAVDRFSKAHDHGVPDQSKYYSELIPLSKPLPGQQYAFEVDLDSCTGCKACVAGCHNLNGLDDDEAWREVGLLVSPTPPKNLKSQLPMLQMITTACHHCAHPACLDGCPVMAYDKDPVTGIVKHLDDQCIGCQYCILKCPYDVPKYSFKRGIVRKCDMCSSRLAVSEAPACVQACPNTAIRIKVVDLEDVKKRAAEKSFVAGAPSPDYTLPTTVYKTKRPELLELVSADQHVLKPDHGHTPLVAMLTIMQLAIGLLFASAALAVILPGSLVDSLRPFAALAALGTIGLGLGVAQLHLGRPQFAFRAFLGLRTSWLSREIIGFGLFAKCAAAFAATFWLDKLVPFVPQVGIVVPYLPLAQKILEPLTLLSGLAATFASVMVYVDTRRPMWTMRYTAPKFFCTALILGAASAPIMLLAASLITQTPLAGSTRHLCLGAVVALTLCGAAKLAYDLSLLRHLRDSDMTPQRKSSLLLTQPLLPFFAARVILSVTGTLLLPLALAIQISALPTLPIFIPLGLAAASFGAAFLGELLERHLFFRASVPLKMPGGSPV